MNTQKINEKKALIEKLQAEIKELEAGKCDKGWNDGSCCCNCANHYEDRHHCTTKPNRENGCCCSEHKGWICLISFEGEKPIAHSGWSEHGMCEMWRKEENIK